MEDFMLWVLGILTLFVGLGVALLFAILTELLVIKDLAVDTKEEISKINLRILSLDEHVLDIRAIQLNLPGSKELG